MVNNFIFILAQGIEFLALIAQLPSILLFGLSRFFYTASGVNNEENDVEDGE